MKKFAALFLIAALLFTSGCWDYKVIDDLALIFAIGIDQDDTDPEKIIVSMNNPAFEEEAEEPVVRTSVTGYSVQQALMNAQVQRNRALALGKLSVLIFSEETAKNGNMHKALQHLEQVQDVDPSSWVCIVRGSTAQQVLYLSPPEQPRAAIYLTELLDISFNEGRVPRVLLFRYWFDSVKEEKAPVIPIIKITKGEEENKRVVVAGLAAIDAQGRMAGEFTDAEMLIYKVLKDEILRGRYYTHIDYAEESRLVTSMIKNINRNIKTEIVKGKPVINLEIRIDLNITDIDLTLESKFEEEIFRGLELALSRDFQGNMLEFLEKTQEWETDVVGLGQFMRIQNPQWFRNRNWAKDYGNSEINVETEVRLKSIGTMVNPR